MTDPTSADFYPPEMENLRDAAAEDALWERICPHRNDAGEQCSYTLHRTGPHTWETSCGHLNCDHEGRGWKCLDCGTHLTQERMVAIIRAHKQTLLSRGASDG